MKRFSPALLAASCAVLLGAACVTDRNWVPPQLVDARYTYQRASTGPARTLAPGKLTEASQALQRAEAEFRTHPHSAMVLDYAYVAQRRAEIAESQARQVLAQQSKEKAEAEVRAQQARLTQQLQQLQGAQAQLAEQERLRQEAQARQQQEAERLRREAEQQQALTQAQIAAQQREQELQQREQQLQAQLEAERQARAEAEARAQSAREGLERIASSVKEEPRGLVVTLSGSLLFASGRSDLLPAARSRLDQVADALREVKDQRIVIEGHTDSRGRDDYNEDLSYLRADSVRSYLISRGIPPEQIEARGYGESRPIADNSTPDGRANNRRVEIVLPRTPSRGVGGSGQQQRQ